MNRESITQALSDRLETIVGLRTYSRKVRDFSQVTPSECPALFLGVGASEVLSEVGRPQLWRLEFIAYLYCHDGSSAGPSSQLNEYQDAIRSALDRDSTDTAGTGVGVATTLGGVCHAARVSTAQTDEGSFGDLGVALITIEVLAAG